MDERTYWVIAVSNVRTPKRRTFITHRTDVVGSALCLFTDYQHAKNYIGQIFWTNQINWDYFDEDFLRVSAGDLADFLAASAPWAARTHVLIDPEFGDEERAL